MLKIIYRLSDAGNQKVKLSTASKKNCLVNCLQIFENEGIILFADHCQPDTVAMVKSLGISPIQTGFGNALSWRNAAEMVLQSADSSDVLYFVEDDYFHLPKAKEVLLEGIQLADYVSLYDHPDKYRDGFNSFVSDGGETSKVLVSESTHWKTTNSTTMTFAVRAKTLKEDWLIWKEFTEKGFPNDFGAFQRLLGMGSWENQIFGKHRRLITPIPAFATHTEIEFLSPLRNWEMTN